MSLRLDRCEFAFGEIHCAKTVMFLEKVMYGLVQAPQAFYNTFRKILTSTEQVQSLFILQDGKGRINGDDGYPRGRLRYRWKTRDFFGNQESNFEAAEYQGQRAYVKALGSSLQLEGGR
jgi:hypothetical protein